MTDYKTLIIISDGEALPHPTSSYNDRKLSSIKYAFKAINVPLNTSLAASHKFNVL